MGGLLLAFSGVKEGEVSNARTYHVNSYREAAASISEQLRFGI
jgi:hypothetical protein